VALDLKKRESGNAKKGASRDAILPGLRGMLNDHPLFVRFPSALGLAALLFGALALLLAVGADRGAPLVYQHGGREKASSGKLPMVR
jgi:hypothetical protein